MELSKIQKEILDAKEPVIFVSSASGSGKTAVLTERVRKAISEGKSVVAFTFTNMAAGEMRKRLGVKNSDMIFIGTIHSYCAQVLFRNGFIEARDCIEEENFNKLFEILQLHPECYPSVDAVFCDEAQDSNEQQLKFMFEMVKSKEYFVIYDIRQSIYSWAGARPDLLAKYRRLYDGKLYSMNENYRCCPNVLRFARSTLQKQRMDDDSIAMRDYNGTVLTKPYGLNTILEILQKTKKYGDWAILARTNAQVQTIQNFLEKNQIPCETFKQGDLKKEELDEKMGANTVKVLTVHSCLTGDTLVQTENGIKRIDEIVSKKDFNEKIYDGKKYSFVKDFISNGIEEVFEIRTGFGASLRATENHEVCVLTQKGIKKIPVKDLKGGEEILVPKNIPDTSFCVPLLQLEASNLDVRARIYPTPTFLTPELAELVGLITADGSYNKRDIYYTKESPECCQRFCDLIYKVFGKEISIKKANDRNMYYAECPSVYILTFLKTNFDGITPNNKKVSSKILQGGKQIYKSFLRGLFEDGTVHLKNGKFDHICLSYKNDEMKPQLQTMLSNLGIDAVYKKYKCQKEINSIYIYSDGAEKFKEIGFITPEKKKRLALCNSKRKIKNKSYELGKVIKENLQNLKMPSSTKGNFTNRENVAITEYTINLLFEKNKEKILTTPELFFVYNILKNYQVERIESIEPCGKEETFCLEMMEEHNFIQNGFLMGNSKGLEWSYVMCVGLNLWSPEECRISYVAITRARDGVLWFSAAKKKPKKMWSWE